MTGSVKGKARALLDDRLAAGDIDIVVGTHALVSDSTQFKRLGLAVVDEQHKCALLQQLVLPPPGSSNRCAEAEAGHDWQCAWTAQPTPPPRPPTHPPTHPPTAACRFGVEQRGQLLAKAFPPPHVLHMTATPIPRTQALIDHGDMTQVLITDLPKGRSAVQTQMLEDGSPKRMEVRGLGCV